VSRADARAVHDELSELLRRQRLAGLAGVVPVDEAQGADQRGPFAKQGAQPGDLVDPVGGLVVAGEVQGEGLFDLVGAFGAVLAELVRGDALGQFVDRGGVVAPFAVGQRADEDICGRPGRLGGFVGDVDRSVLTFS